MVRMRVKVDGVSGALRERPDPRRCRQRGIRNELARADGLVAPLLGPLGGEKLRYVESVLNRNLFCTVAHL